MTQLTEPVRGLPTEGGSRRLALLAPASLIAPAVPPKQAVTGGPSTTSAPATRR